MEYPAAMDPEFLRSEEGKRFVRQLIDILFAKRTAEPPDDVRDAFETLKHEYIEHLAQHLREYHTMLEPEENELTAAFETVYFERFAALYPKERPMDFLLDLTRQTAWLAAITSEVWLIATGNKPSWYPPDENTTVRAMHFYWARDAFGWWLAGLARFKYDVNIRRRPIPVVDAIRAALTPEQLERLRYIEVDNGCPLC